MKDTLPYFSHDNNAGMHPKMVALIAEYGTSGYGMFWLLNETIARSEGAYIDISKKINKANLATLLRIELNKLDEFLAYLSDPEIDLINIQDNKITTDRINDLHKEVMEKREAARAKKQQKKEKQESSDGKGDFSGGKQESSAEPNNKEEEIKEEERKEKKNKRNSCGKPPKSRGNKKPKKSRLRDREPENDMELVEKAYWANWDLLYSNQMVTTQDPVVRWEQTRSLIKGHFEKKITPMQLVDVINSAMKDKWIMQKGYSLENILTCSYVNSVINKMQSTDNETTEIVLQKPLYQAALSCFEKDLKTKFLINQDEYSQKIQLQCLHEIIKRMEKWQIYKATTPIRTVV